MNMNSNITKKLNKVEVVEVPGLVDLENPVVLSNKKMKERLKGITTNTTLKTSKIWPVIYVKKWPVI